MDAVELRNEALSLYFSEVEDSQQTTGDFEEENPLVDESELAADFLRKAGLADLSEMYHKGNEIPEKILNDSICQKRLTEKQAQTVRSRVYLLNKTLINRQPRRKQRLDVRNVAWNIETSSTGSRSRSATPDSLDSIPPTNEDLTSDEDQHSSLPSFPENVILKGKLKSTSSESTQSKSFFTVSDRGDIRGDVAQLGSDSVVLKRYLPLKELPNVVFDNEHINTVNELKSMNKHGNANYSTTDFQNVIPIPNCTISLPQNNLDNSMLSFEGMIRNQEVQTNSFTKGDFRDRVCIDNISDSEYQYLKPLLWVEVSAIFDHYKIFVVKRKATNKNKRGNVFGVNLSTLVMRDMPIPTDTSMVPQVYQVLLSHLNNRCLKEDGVLRIGAHKQKLDTICNEIELNFYSNQQHVEMVLNQAGAHELTGVLKKLLRELPDPVFTMEFFDMFYKCSMITNFEDKKRALNMLVLLLPIEHRNTFRLLLNFFNGIILNEQSNRMNLHNVAMIGAPSFFPPRILSPKNSKYNGIKDQLAKEIKDAAISCSVMETILRVGDELSMIPIELVVQAQEAQSRAQIRKEKKSHLKKKLQRSVTQYEPGAMIDSRIKRDFV